MTSILHRFLALFFSCFFILPLAGQRQANHWHFGDGISIDFSSSTPVLNPPSSMFTQEGCISVSDANGNLLFYSNGGGRPTSTNTNPGMIWNRNNDVMYNMEGNEGGGFSARQSSISFPVPGQQDQYYLFTMEEEEFTVGGSPADQPLGRGLSYFIIDMSLNNGFGGVLEADVRVFTPAYDGLTAISMPDQSGYWVIAYANQVQLVVVPVTTDGVGEPVLHTVEGQGSFSNQIKASPDGNWIFCNRRLIRFDPSTGTPLPEEAFSIPNINPLSTEFTPNSRFLYSVSNSAPGRRIIRYDLLSSDILGTQSVLFIFGGGGLTYQMQMGPNGSLYFLEDDAGTNRQGLSEISCPATNMPSVNRFIVPLEGESFAVGLPNFPANIFAPLAGTEDTLRISNESNIVCTGQSITFAPINQGETYQWSDGSTDNLLTTNQPGSYEVTITGGCQPTIESFQLLNLPDLIANIEVLSDTSLLCADQDSIVLSFMTDNNYQSFTWRVLGENEMTFTNDTIQIPVIEGSQTIIFSITNECEIFQDTFTYINDTFSASLNDDSSERLCPGDEVSFFVDGTNIEAIIWEDGSTGANRLINAADSSIDYSALVISLCGDSLQLNSELDYSRCPIVCEAILPDLISPNRDGVNDAFRIFTNCPLENFNMRIFNRWGQMVFNNNDQNISWDGTFKGEPQPMDVYIYRVSYKFPDNPEIFTVDGQFSLVR